MTTGEDAAHAAKAGANFIGMILWPKSKRSIDVGAAREVVAAAKEGGALPVGVFVSENAEEVCHPPPPSPRFASILQRRWRESGGLSLCGWIDGWPMKRSCCCPGRDGRVWIGLVPREGSAA